MLSTTMLRPKKVCSAFPASPFRHKVNVRNVNSTVDWERLQFWPNDVQFIDNGVPCKTFQPQPSTTTLNHVPFFRKFDMKFLNQYNQEVIHFRRPFAYMFCNCCCLSELTVEAPVGKVIGRVKQLPGGCQMRLRVECPVGTHVATVNCPCACKCFCFGDVPYPITDTQGKLYP